LTSSSPPEVLLKEKGTPLHLSFQVFAKRVPWMSHAVVTSPSSSSTTDLNGEVILPSPEFTRALSAFPASLQLITRSSWTTHRHFPAQTLLLRGHSSFRQTTAEMHATALAIKTHTQARQVKAMLRG